MADARPERLRLADVRKTFRARAGAVEVLRGVSLALGAGEFGVITGPSGSGKTTLLMVAGLLQTADAGQVWFDGRDVSGLDERERADVRKRGVGMVFQKFCLLPHRSALDNVEFRFRYLERDARAGPAAETAAGRRTHGQPRSRVRRPRHGPVSRTEPRRHVHPPRHPQSRLGRAGHDPLDDARRPPGARLIPAFSRPCGSGSIPDTS